MCYVHLSYQHALGKFDIYQKLRIIKYIASVKI